MNPRVVTKYINILDRTYGTDKRGTKIPLTIRCGKQHEYLGMILNYRTPRKVKINMTKYTTKMLDDAGSLFPGSAVTLAVNPLFEINEKTEILSVEDSERFHHLVTQLLFLSKRAQPDM